MRMDYMSGENNALDVQIILKAWSPCTIHKQGFKYRGIDPLTSIKKCGFMYQMGVGGVGSYRAFAKIL